MTDIRQDPLPTRPGIYFDPATSVFFDETLDTWNVFSYNDVLRVLNEKATFSSGYGWTDADRNEIHPMMNGMWGTDGQRHDDLRAAVAEPFRRSVIEGLAPRAQGTTTALIDGILQRGTGQMEVVADIAKPLPGHMICEILGLDLSFAAQAHAWLDEVYEVTVTTHNTPKQQDLTDFFMGVIESRRRSPQTGLVDDLIASQAAGYLVDGAPMKDRELIGYFAMLLVAGVDDVGASMANMVLFLTEYGFWDEIGADPSLVRGAVEESLRWYPAFPGVRRLTIQDTEIGGQHIAAGQWVTGWLTAANRDPVRFANPNTFDIRRDPNPNLTLGSGRHLCLGAQLTRVEMRILLEEMTRRLPGLRRDPDAPISRRVFLVDSLDEAHFRFPAVSG